MTRKHLNPNRTILLLILATVAYAVTSCITAKEPPKKIIEHDPIVKKLEEHDSLRVIRKHQDKQPVKQSTTDKNNN